MLLSVGVQLTTRCNLNCTHCFVQSCGDDIRVEALEKVMSYARTLGCSEINITGGEPSIYRRWPAVLDLLGRHGLQFSMVSNGWNLAEFLATLGEQRKNLKVLSISLDGATEDVHDSTRGRGSYRRVLQAASVCRCQGIRFGLRMTVTRRNIHQLEEMALLAAKIGAAELAVVPLLPTPTTALAGLLLHPRDLDRIVDEAQRLQAVFTVRIRLTAGYRPDDVLFPCPTLAMRSLFITARGDLAFCCHLADYRGAQARADALGNLEECSLAELHGRMVSSVAGLQKEKIRQLADGSLTALDSYPCWYCLKRFGKVNWMVEFPENPWTQDLVGQEAMLCPPAAKATGVDERKPVRG